MIAGGSYPDRGLPADAFLANDPVAMNLMLHGFHEAIMVMTMEWSCLRGSADGDNGCQGDHGREKQAFHVKPRKHWGLMLRVHA